MFRMSVLKHMFQMIVKYWNGARGAFIEQTTANQYSEEDIFFWNAFDVNALSKLYIINILIRFYGENAFILLKFRFQSVTKTSISIKQFVKLIN